jgi:hypothetical protein
MYQIGHIQSVPQKTRVPRATFTCSEKHIFFIVRPSTILRNLGAHFLFFFIGFCELLALDFLSKYGINNHILFLTHFFFGLYYDKSIASSKTSFPPSAR